MLTKDIITERLRIRSTKEEDSPLCFSIWLDDEMGKYLCDPPRESASEAYMNFAKDIEEDESWYPFVVFSKETNEFIGTCSLVPMEDPQHWDLGYCVHKKYWRQGYAIEMIKALITFGYENDGSNGVLKKLGFFIERDGSFKKQGTDIVYSEYTYRLDLE